ncbi:hypothetical protein LJC72_06350 [Bacteroides sp. OttesenSCG-928-D19]|nr:hypothetical protein [Bacteroides sp. OttesenSCG-928-D19]
MKKISLYFVVMLLSVVNLTSCLDGSNESTGEAIGVVDFSTKSTKPVLKTYYGEFYAPELSTLLSDATIGYGDCLYIYYKIDYDLAENSPAMVETNGYYTVSLYNYVPFERNYLSHYLTDTATVMADNEVAILDGLCLNGGINGFYDRYMFVTHIVNQPENLELRWDLSYDRESMMPTEENSKRYYDLFVRAVPTNTSEKTKVDYPHCVSYDMGSYLREVAQAEKEALGGSYVATNSKFTLRVNYPSEIKGDTIVWSHKEWEQYVASFLPAEN